MNCASCGGPTQPISGQYRACPKCDKEEIEEVTDEVTAPYLLDNSTWRLLLPDDEACYNCANCMYTTIHKINDVAFGKTCDCGGMLVMNTDTGEYDGA